MVGYAVASASGITGYLVGTGASAASGTMEFQTSSYPAGYQFPPFAGSSYAYGLATEEMLDPQSTVIAGQEFPAPNGIFSSGLSYLDSSNLTGLFSIQQFDLFKYAWSADGSGTWGGNTYMVTNQSKFFLHRHITAERTPRGDCRTAAALEFVSGCADNRPRSN